MKCLNCGNGEYVPHLQMIEVCPACGSTLTTIVKAKIAAMQAEFDGQQSLAMERQLRSKAEAHSAAADLMCNQWNRLDRSESWSDMSNHFQGIWEDMKAVSGDYHKLADAESQRGYQRANCTTAQPCGVCERCKGGDDEL